MSSLSKCIVCEENDSEIRGNPVFECEGCKIGVHKCCYGITAKTGNADPWWCSPCSIGRNDAICQLCLQSGGALKKTTCNRFVHVICALFTENVAFLNNTRMEPVRITRALDYTGCQRCVFCLKSCGVCSKCTSPDCNYFLHITCGQKNQSLKEKTNPKNQKINFEAFCHEHKQKESTRRISSIFVAEAMSEKEEESDQFIEGGETGDETDASNKSHAYTDGTRSNDSRTSSDDIGNGFGFSNETFASITVNDIQSVAGNLGNAEASNQFIDRHETSDDADTSNKSHSSTDGTRSNDSRTSSDGTGNEFGFSTPKPVDGSISIARSFWWDYAELKKREDELEIQLDLKDEEIAKLKSKKKQLKGEKRNLEVENLQRIDELEAELNLKAEKIFKLKSKKQQLREKVRGLEIENLNLQKELRRQNSQVNQQLFVSNSSGASGSTGVSMTNTNIDRLNSLMKCIATKPSDDGSELVYPNGVRVAAKSTKQLKKISGDPESDRNYINASFFIFFPENIILDAIGNGKLREKILSEFRDSEQYEILRDAYEYRVRQNGKGDLESRINLLKLAFRQKFNNWWQNHGPKNIAHTAAM